MDKYQVSIQQLLNNLLSDSIKKITLNQGLDEHKSRLDVIDNIKQSTKIRSYFPAYRELKKHFGPDWKIIQTTQFDAEKFLSKFNSHKYYKRLIHSVCNKIYKDFVSLGYSIVNPFQQIPKPRVAASEITIIPNDDFKKILQHIKKNMFEGEKANKRIDIYSNALLMQRFSGARPGEVLALKKRNVLIDDVNNTASIVYGNREHTTKTNKSRLVKVNGIAFEAIKQRYDLAKTADSYLFTFNRKPITVDAVSKIFKRACKDLNMPDTYHLYCLRATYASELINSGIQIQQISKILGHAEITTTERFYSRLDVVNFGEVLQVLENNSINNNSNQLKRVV